MEVPELHFLDNPLDFCRRGDSFNSVELHTQRDRERAKKIQKVTMLKAVK